MSKQQENQGFLKQFIEDEADTLLNILSAYAVRMGIATPHAASTVAGELLSDLVIEALQHAHRYDTDRRPMAWLLGIGVNLIKRRKARQARLEQREPLLRDMIHPEGEQFSDGELFDRFVAITIHSPTQKLEENEEVLRLLSHLSEDNRLLLRLAVLHDMNGELLAGALGITPGAARVRLHRALKLLRGLLVARRYSDNE